MPKPVAYEEFELYNGEVKVKFYPKSHMYKVTDPKYGLVDKRVKGVTTYLGIKDKSAALVSWAGDLIGQHLVDILASGMPVNALDIYKAMGLPNEKKEEAADIGKVTHAWCEYFVKHKLGVKGYEVVPTLPEDKETLLGVDSFLQFVKKHRVVFLGSERIVYSRIYQYIGQMDFEAMVDDEFAVGDLKTSNGLYNTVLAQMSGYQNAAEEEEAYLDSIGVGTGKRYSNRVAVRLAKKTEDEHILECKRKNDIKVGQGRSASEIKPYLALETHISLGREEFERDFKAFLTHKDLFEWDAATDFYKNKQSEEDESK